MEVASGNESLDKEAEPERMKEEEFNNQCNRFCRLVTFNDQQYIGPLTYEIKAIESMLRYNQQQKKSSEKKRKESYAQNRKLRDWLYSLSEIIGTQPGSDPATTQSTQRNITLLPNPNERAQTW